MNNLSKKMKFLFRLGNCVILTIFVMNSVVPSCAYGQSVLNLPSVGAMVGISPSYAPIAIKGLKVFPDNPFRFDFILDTGNSKLAGEQLKSESSLLIKYFLAALTVPDDDQWVNLSPYEKDRVIPQEFGITEMGRDLLAQDYLLKQLTASLIYPEHELGKKFWERVHKKAYEKYGDVDIPVSTFNKVWVMPEHAKVYESGVMAFIVESHLKVMLDADYVALVRSAESLSSAKGVALKNSENSVVESAKKENTLGTEIIREVVLPEIEKEVNEGRNFTKLRQIYHSMIMAAWFKRKLKDSVLSKIYVGTNKVSGVDVDDKEIKQKIYDQYLAAFKQGVYNYIREEFDEKKQETTPRKYFSGGVMAGKAVASSTIFEERTPAALTTAVSSSTIGQLITASAGIDPIEADAKDSQSASSSIIDKMVSISRGEGTWEELQKQWEIGELIYSPGGIQKSGLKREDGTAVTSDEFGNYPHWVYALHNFEDDRIIYVGPNDVLTLFPEQKTYIDQLRAEKENESKEEADQLQNIIMMEDLLGVTEHSSDLIRDEDIDHAKPGDRHFARIDQVYDEFVKLFREQFSQEISLPRFLEILQDMTQTINISKRWNQLRYLSQDEQISAANLVARIKNKQKITKEDVEILAHVHAKILAVKNSPQTQSRGWGKGIAQSVQIDPRFPAFHADIAVASWLAQRFSDRRGMMIVDIGANNSILWQVLGSFSDTLAGGVVDLEKDEAIYDQAPNDNKVNADIADLTEQGLPKVHKDNNGAKIYFEESHLFDVATINFVLDQLKPEQVRDALKSIEHLLALAKQQPLLIITLPENSPLQNSEFDKVLQELGYRVITQGVNLTNALTSAARERIRNEEGEEYLREIETTFAKKIFHMGIYEKTRDVNDSEIDTIDLNRLKIRQGSDRWKIGNSKGDSPIVTRFSAHDVDLTDAFVGLTEKDFEARAGESIVTRDEIKREESFSDFEDHLTALLWFKNLSETSAAVKSGLSPKISADFEVAERVAEAWDVKDAPFLSGTDVKMIMSSPEQEGLRFEQIKAALPNLVPYYVDQRRKLIDEWNQRNSKLPERQFYASRQKFMRSLEDQVFLLKDLYDREEQYRKEKGLEAISKTVRNRTKNIPTDDKIESAQKWANENRGKTIDESTGELTARFGLDYNTMLGIVESFQIITRRRELPNKEKFEEWAEANRGKTFEKTQQQIAKEFGLTVGMVWKTLFKNKITTKGNTKSAARSLQAGVEENSAKNIPTDLKIEKAQKWASTNRGKTVSESIGDLAERFELDQNTMKGIMEQNQIITKREMLQRRAKFQEWAEANKGKKFEKTQQQIAREFGLTNNQIWSMLVENRITTRGNTKSAARSLQAGVDENREKKVAGDNSESASSAVKDVGGIDMNQKGLDLQIEGEGIQFDMPFNPTQLQNISIDGFTPVILQIIPTNLPLFIGVNQSREEMKVSSL